MTSDPSKLDFLRREVAAIEARKPLNRPQVIALLCRQAGGIPCGCGCGEPLDALGEGVIDEHVTALEMTGSNELGNRGLWRKPCSKAKTKREAPIIAKVKRLAGETCTAPGKPIPQRQDPWPKGRKLTSRNTFDNARRKETQP